MKRLCSLVVASAIAVSAFTTTASASSRFAENSGTFKGYKYSYCLSISNEKEVWANLTIGNPDQKLSIDGYAYTEHDEKPGVYGPKVTFNSGAPLPRGTAFVKKSAPNAHYFYYAKGTYRLVSKSNPDYLAVRK